MISTGSLDLNLMQELFGIMRESRHEKVSRGLAIALGMMCYAREEEADTFIA